MDCGAIGSGEVNLMSADAGDAAVDSAVPVDYILALEDPTRSLKPGSGPTSR